MIRRTRPVLALAVLGLFLSSCLSTHVQPLPEAPERPPTEIRGIVVEEDGEGERIEFERVDHVEWTDSTVVLVGVVKGSDGAGSAMAAAETLAFPVSSVTGVLVRGVDANRASIFIAAVGVGAAAIAALLLTGKGDEYRTGTGGL